MIDKLRAHFDSFATLDPDYRISQLKNLKEGILANLPELNRALWTDLHKSGKESYLTEISLVLGEIDYHIRHVRRWSRPRRKGSPLMLFPSRSRILYQPYGVVLIIAPWNYPVQLLFSPLVAALSAGNCVLLKPSPSAPHVSAVCTQIVKEYLDDRCVQIREGGPQIMEQILEEKFDYIFYTGGPAFGKTILEKAAATLTPVTLELGGKSPCIVNSGADLSTAARRIAWGKFLNAGQTCVAPDYVLVENRIKEKFIGKLKEAVIRLYAAQEESVPLPERFKNSPYYGRIISRQAFQRLTRLLDGSHLVFGGNRNEEELFIEPALADLGTLANMHDPTGIMQEEIFGPVLPVCGYQETEEVLCYVNGHPKPLALYVFADKCTARRILRETFSGGACVNDTVMHLANKKLPFGGVGNSGMGNYHGKYGFITFSHAKAVVLSPRRFDLPVRYPPYKGFGIIRRIL